MPEFTDQEIESLSDKIAKKLSDHITCKIFTPEEVTWIKGTYRSLTRTKGIIMVSVISCLAVTTLGAIGWGIVAFIGVAFRKLGIIN